VFYCVSDRIPTFVNPALFLSRFSYERQGRPLLVESYPRASTFLTQKGKRRESNVPPDGRLVGDLANGNVVCRSRIKEVTTSIPVDA